ncbi:unnamed protein product [Pedinophyceae sp. YPF-701]|nr:unnamed protein product [Pedinophyceae sp. YPF-701]
MSGEVALVAAQAWDDWVVANRVCDEATGGLRPLHFPARSETALRALAAQGVDIGGLNAAALATAEGPKTAGGTPSTPQASSSSRSRPFTAPTTMQGVSSGSGGVGASPDIGNKSEARSSPRGSAEEDMSLRESAGARCSGGCGLPGCECCDAERAGAARGAKPAAAAASPPERAAPKAAEAPARGRKSKAEDAASVAPTRRAATSRYHGVCAKAGGAGWRAYTYLPDRQVGIAVCDTEVEAARAVDAYILKHRVQERKSRHLKPLNFPWDHVEELKALRDNEGIDIGEENEAGMAATPPAVYEGGGAAQPEVAPVPVVDVKPAGKAKKTKERRGATPHADADAAAAGGVEALLELAEVAMAQGAPTPRHRGRKATRGRRPAEPAAKLGVHAGVAKPGGDRTPPQHLEAAASKPHSPEVPAPARNAGPLPQWGRTGQRPPVSGEAVPDAQAAMVEQVRAALAPQHQMPPQGLPPAAFGLNMASYLPWAWQAAAAQAAMAKLSAETNAHPSTPPNLSSGDPRPVPMTPTTVDVHDTTVSRQRAPGTPGGVPPAVARHPNTQQ